MKIIFRIFWKKIFFSEYPLSISVKLWNLIKQKSILGKDWMKTESEVRLYARDTTFRREHLSNVWHFIASYLLIQRLGQCGNGRQDA